MPFYATHDANNDQLATWARIVRFDTEADARTWLAQPYDEPIQVVAGSFGDAWLKLTQAPRPGDRSLAPFAYTQMHVQRPGTHPGGRMWWVTPHATVLVAILQES